MFDPDEVLEFWFPDNGHWHDIEAHRAFWTQRTQGGMDAEIIRRFDALTRAAATGQLDDWAGTTRGRLALLIALDQFPRSLWRDTPGAYAQDIKAARLALTGIARGDIGALAPWEGNFYVIAIVHCEGPQHLERIEALSPVIEQLTAALPAPLAAMGERMRGQQERVKGVIARFGRHPHRNAILGRLSTPEEAAYIEAGDFPHLAQPEA